MRRTLRFCAVTVLATLFSALVLPACVITVGSGGESNESVGTGGGTGGTNPAGAGGGAVEELDPVADEAVLMASDPTELSRAQLRSNVAAYLFQGYLEQEVGPVALQGADAEALAAAAQGVVDAYGAEIWAYADQYVESLDPSLLPAAVVVIPDQKCLSTFGCPATMDLARRVREACLEKLRSFCGPEYVGELPDVPRAVDVGELPEAPVVDDASAFDAWREALMARSYDSGFDRGKDAGLVEALFTVLAARGIAVGAEARARIEGCSDSAALKQWLAKAGTVESVEGLFVVEADSKAAPGS